MCFNLACEPNKEDIEMDSSDRDQAALMNVAISKHEERTDRIDAINKLTNQDYLESIAVDTSNSCYIRIAAIKKLTNDAVLKVLAIGETEKHEYEIRVAAIENENLTNPGTLLELALDDLDYREVNEAAKKKLMTPSILAEVKKMYNIGIQASTVKKSLKKEPQNRKLVNKFQI